MWPDMSWAGNMKQVNHTVYIKQPASLIHKLHHEVSDLPCFQFELNDISHEVEYNELNRDHHIC